MSGGSIEAPVLRQGLGYSVGGSGCKGLGFGVYSYRFSERRVVDTCLGVHDASFNIVLLHV